MQITITTHDPHNLKVILEMGNQIQKKPPSEATQVLDDLHLKYEGSDDINKAPTLHFQNETQGTTQKIKVKDFSLQLPTTFYPIPGAVLCLLGDGVLKIEATGRDKAKIKALNVRLRRRLKEEGLSAPAKIYDAATTDIKAINAHDNMIAVKGDYKTADLAEALGIGVPAVRHHLRQLEAEGYKLGGEKNSWKNEEDFLEVIELIKPRIGAHGRRSKK